MNRLSIVFLSLSLVGAISSVTADDTSPKSVYPQASFGPFSMDGSNYTVMVDIIGPPSALSREPAESFSIIDDSGQVVYQRDLPTKTSKGWAMEVHAKGVEGEGWKGILIRYTFSPSAPREMDPLQFLVLKENRVVPLSPPIGTNGGLEKLPKGSVPDSVRLLGGDIFELKVWTGRFGIKVPFRVDFPGETVKPISLAGKFDFYGATPFWRKEGSTVRLYANLELDAKPVEVKITSESKIYFTDCFAKVKWPPSSSTLEKWWIEIKEAYLKVSIDGIEGWVKHPEDEFNLGLRFIG